MKATHPITDPKADAFARRGAIAFLVIALLEVLVGLLVPALNGIYALATGNDATLVTVPWWALVLIPVAWGVLLALTYPPSRHYLGAHGGIRLINSPFAIASFALFWFVVSLVATNWISSVASLAVAVAGAVIDIRQNGVLPFFAKGFRLSFGRKNRANRIKAEREAAEAYARVPNSERLPVLTRAGRWAIAPVVTLVITLVLAVARVVTPIYVLLALVGGATTGLLLVVVLHNLYARRAGIYLDLPTPYVTSYHYLPDEVRAKYHLRWSGQRVGLLSGLVELVVFAVAIAAWMVAVFLWTPIF